MKKLGIIFTMLVLVLGVSGCSNTGVGQQIESKGNTVNNQYANDYDTFIATMIGGNQTILNDLSKIMGDSITNT